MISVSFFRWTACCVLAGALILGTGYLLRANIDKQFIDEFASTQALVSSIMVAAGSLLFLFGLPALFATQNLYSSRSGIIAAVFCFTGIAAFHLGTIALYFIVPVLVKHSEATRALIYSDVPPFPRFAFFWAAGLLIQVIGLLWIGFKTWRNANSPRPGAFLLIAAALLFLSAPFIYFPLIKPANTLAMTGFGFIAISMLRSKAKIISFQAENI